MSIDHGDKLRACDGVGGKSHAPIIWREHYDSKECPLCARMEEVEEAGVKVKALESSLEKANEDLEEARDEVLLLKQAASGQKEE